MYGIILNNNKLICMHRYLMNSKNKEIIDHINHNKIDNRLHNLRISSSILNGHNKTKQQNTSSKYIGVCLNKQIGKFQAQIIKEGKRYYLGCFKTEKEAAQAYNNKAIELYGKFANLNIISSF